MKKPSQEENKLATAFILAALGNYPSFVSRQKPYIRNSKPMKKCSLPGCNTLTDKGYCSAEHSKKHDELIREKRKLSLTSK